MNISVSNKDMSLEPCRQEHYAIRAAIYKSTRRKELSQVENWSEEQKDAFLDQQFAFQHIHYQKNYPGASFYLIKYQNNIIGRLYIHPEFENKSIRIIDIAILPQWQNKGLGTSLLNDILNEAKLLNRPVSIHVESFNPAMNLYKRLGFKKVSETNGVYFLFEKMP